MDKQKKTLIIGGIVEGAVLIFDLIVSILVWTTIVTQDEMDTTYLGMDFKEASLAKNGGFIGNLQAEPMIFFAAICIPLFLIIAVDFVYFAYLAMKKESNLSDAQLEAIKKKAREQAEAELLAELNQEQNPEAPAMEEKPEE